MNIEIDNNKELILECFDDYNYNFELNFESGLIFETSKRFKMLIIIEGTNHNDILNITNYDESVIFYEI